MEIAQAAGGIYVIGVLIGLWRVDAHPASRLGWALLWPVGPVAFAATLATLVVVALIAAVARN